MKKIHDFLAVAIAASLISLPAVAQEDVVFETSSVEISSDGVNHDFTVEVADSPEETARGLMFRESLADDAGMLFDFDPPREPQMWMRNTLIPLDMLFLDDQGVIIMIARSAQPGSERRITPGTAVRGVLELPGGRAEALNITAGDIVRHEIFGNVAETAED